MLPLLLSLLSFTPANEYFNGTQLNTAATFQGTKMIMTGYALGMKKVGMARVKIAVNQFFTEQPQYFVRNADGVITSLGNVGLTCMHLTFLRSLDASQVQGFINQYLGYFLSAEEKIIYKEDIAKVLDAIKTETVIYAGKSVSVIGDVKNNTIYYENSAGGSVMIHSQNAGFVVKILSVWFGEPFDNDGYNLQQGLFRIPTVTEAGR